MSQRPASTRRPPRPSAFSAPSVTRRACATAVVVSLCYAAPLALAAPTSSASPTCTPRLPEGREAPKVETHFPARGLSGHVAWLEATIEHQKADVVMPGGVTTSLDTEATSALREAGFILPDPSGPARPSLETKPRADGAVSTLRLAVVPLPKETGRHELELPPLPLSIARASGEVVTVCSEPHAMVVDEPIANDPDPKPRRNLPPQRQQEIWQAAKSFALIAVPAFAFALLLAWIWLRHRDALKRILRRVFPPTPPPPPRPPWDVARERLFDLRHAGLVSSGRYAEHYDRVSDTIRQYLGDRYGLDGLEMTTDELLDALRAVSLRMELHFEISQFLRDADLVKFARSVPSEAQCEESLTDAERLIRDTMPEDETKQHAPDASPSQQEAGR